MKRGLPSLIAGGLLIVILGLYMVFYQVSTWQVAVERTFGRITPPGEDGQSPDVITEAGPYWKWPWPIQKVKVYDNRIHITQTTGEETPTRDGKNVIVTTSIGWQIADAYVFSINNKDEKDAEEKLKTRVRNDQKTVLANYDFANLVSTDPAELKYDEIEEQIKSAVNVPEKGARELYGIDVSFIGISQLELPQQITANVFEAMKQERQAQAQRYRSEGESEAARVKADAEKIAKTIVSFADRKADEIVAEGLRRAAEYNDTFSQDEDLAMFLLKIKYLGDIFKDRTTIILSSEPPADLIREAESPAEKPGAAPKPSSPAATRPAGQSSIGDPSDEELAAAANAAPPDMVRRR